EPSRVGSSIMSAVTLMLWTFFTVPGQAPAPTVKDVAWIAGCWSFDRNGRHVAEHWMPPEAGTMMGVSRTTARGQTYEWEVLLTGEGAKGVEYVAKPSRQAETTFTAASATAAEVVFENPAHDFPKKV